MNDSTTPTKHYNMFFDQLHFVMEDQQFKIIYYLMAFQNWSSQQGAHFVFRPGYNVRPSVTYT